MAGFTRYFRFICRRERLVSGLWFIILCACTPLFAAIYPSFFDGGGIKELADMLASPAMVGLMGPPYPDGVLTLATLFSQTMGVWVVLSLGVMNIFLVNRHTRADEEAGRLELFRSLPVGRLTGVAAVTVFTVLVNLFIAVITALLLILVDVEGTTIAGSFAYAGAVGAAGFVFAGAALLSAQLFTTARGALGGGMAVLGAAYVLRAAGDVSGGWLGYLSPMGLCARVFPFYVDDPLPLSLLLLECAVLFAAAFALAARRDLGAGVFPARKGRSEASRFLRSPLGLAWRLSRNAMFIWCGVMFIAGVLYGSILGDMADFVASNEMFRRMLEAGASADDLSAGLTEQYLALLMAVMAILACVPVLNLTARVRREEQHGLLSPVLACAVPRAGMFGCYLFLAFVMSIAAMLCAAFGLYAPAAGLGMLSLWDCVRAALVYLPALWVMAGLCALLAGALPRLTALCWVVFAYSFLSIYLGRMYSLPEWTVRITPFGHVPQVPVQAFAAPPLLAMTAAAAALCACGVWRFTKRDIV